MFAFVIEVEFTISEVVTEPPRCNPSDSRVMDLQNENEDKEEEEREEQEEEGCCYDLNDPWDHLFFLL